MKKLAVVISLVIIISLASIIKLVGIDKMFKSINTYNPISENGEQVKTIAHRGGMAYAPENTLAAYETAGRLGFWGAECDTVSTKDGQWILMHDPKVERTTNGKGKVSELTLKDIRKLRIDTGSNISSYPGLKVPTLQEYLEICKRYNMIPIIEIKESLKNNYNKFIDILTNEGVMDSCIVISFSQKELMNISVLNSSINLQLLIDHPITMKDINVVKAIGNCNINTKEPTKEGIRMANENGVLVNCYLINSIDRAKTVLNMGVSYFTTDWINKID